MTYIEGKVGNHIMQIKDSEGGIHSNIKKIMNNGGEREPELLYMLRKEISPGDICIDLGANIGYITLLMCEILQGKGKVYSIEPDPENVKLLNQNIKLNNYTELTSVSQMAISNENGFGNFYFGLTSNLGGLHRTKNTHASSLLVKLQTLSSFCKEHHIFPSMIKMDIEGGEVEVLDGFYEYVMKYNFPCKIIMELHPTTYHELHSLDFWIRKYLNIDFRFKYIASAGVVIPDLFKQWNYFPIKEFDSNRGLYEEFSVENMIKACCYENKQWIENKKKFSPKIARFLMIEKN